MSDTLRELTQVLDDYSRRLRVPLRDAILPLVEQAIRERDAQIAALQEWLKTQEHRAVIDVAGVLFDLRARVARLRETPAPPEPTITELLKDKK